MGDLFIGIRISVIRMVSLLIADKEDCDRAYKILR